MASKEEVSAAFEEIKENFGLDELKSEQLDILTSIIRNEDCVGVLPTGYGKSLPYQVAKGVANKLGKEFHKIIVCSPLISLMQDQVARLQKFGNGLKVMYKGQKDYCAVEECDIIFSSPEHLVGNDDWRGSLSKLKVSLIVVDEFHTVSTWGELSKNEHEKVFRRWFRYLGEVRSLFPEASMLALSATCTDEILKEVLQALSMEGAKHIIVSPDKGNIKYSVFRTGRTMEPSLFWLIDELHENFERFPRTLIYCNSIQDVARVFTYFKKELPDCSVIEMFHSETSDKKKMEIVTDLSSSEGVLKVVVCTSALGMGVDIKNCQNIILYGPPRNVVDLVQIVGRAGRDGCNASALLLCSSYQIGHVDKNMKGIINDDACRRKNIMKHFMYAEVMFDQELHRCCDNCAQKCLCKKCEMPYLESLYIDSHTLNTNSPDENSESDSD